MKVNKRVILMTPSMSKGGAETQLLKIASFLQSKHHKVLIISLKPIDEFNGDIRKLGLEALFLRDWLRYPISNIQSLYKTVKRFRPDVIIAFMFVAIIFARLLKLKLNFKLISTIRISVMPKKWYMPFKLTDGLDDVIVYNSFASMTNFEKQKLVSKRGIVIPNGIAIPEHTKTGNDLVNDSFKWICIGHFRWNKDYLTLFKAIALLKHRNFTVDIVGDLNGELWPKKTIEELNIQDYVNIMGFRKETHTYLGQSDAFVLSSFSEGMPNAILEAMAYARPTVVTDIDGNHELIEKAQCGLLCEKQNEQDMANNMLKIMDMSVADREALGTKGRQHIKDGFSEEKVMGEWMQLIDRLAI
ncbi:glycosyl transferase [Pedobacter ginsengisoli]|uniref:Glycosyl transferase n=1 Tax=Pedobacter ginsengisoli TaxID=363852 RepID=A0A2D1U3C3_9SPHI|nr:glycosyltransferase family 4 protein [Pedobacter ginsengisoli]ATP56101.1 glycosyl transferase [Pedobacter ginsengisoli]